MRFFPFQDKLEFLDQQYFCLNGSMANSIFLKRCRIPGLTSLPLGIISIHTMAYVGSFFLIAYRRLDITLRQSVTVGLNKPLMDLGLPLKFLSHLVHKAIVLFHPLHRQLQVWLLSIHMALMAPIFLILWGLILAIRRWMLLNDGMP